MSTRIDERPREESCQAALCSASTELAVEIGAVKLTLEQLVDLQEGQVLEFRFNPNNLVTLTLGDEQLALARFVLQEDELLLQIEKMLR